MKCKCGSEMKVKKENYQYTESGLDNVILQGVEVRRCPKCGSWEVVLPRLAELHRTLARAVATGSSPLRPQEIRFLRKYLGYSGADFARAIGVSPETLSRWENGKAEPNRMVDLLLRYMALTRDPLTEYPPVAPSVVEQLPQQIGRKARTSGFQLRETHNHWQAQPAAA
jgi:putative zinc finger/helix-turn-helix YgiT family protein